MALYTSTPKSKRLIEEEVSLLSMNSENEGEHIYNHNIFFSVYFVIPVQKQILVCCITLNYLNLNNSFIIPFLLHGICLKIDING